MRRIVERVFTVPNSFLIGYVISIDGNPIPKASPMKIAPRRICGMIFETVALLPA
jgi:hypothetical protein